MKAAAAAFSVIASLATLLTATGLAQDAKVAGPVKVSGSSTVYPLAEAVIEEFAAVAPKVNVTLGEAGTGGGFKQFVEGAIDISNASRPIKKSEAEMAAAKGIEFVELPVAYDGLTVVVNPENTWVKQLTIAQIKRIFTAENPAKTWKDVDPSWPAEAIKLYSPGTDSGTFDYFKEVVAGKDGVIRSDMSVSENDNVLVRGVAGDKNAIGFFGFAYFVANKGKLRDIPIVNPKTNAAVEPTPATIVDGSYAPFSRPLFIYVNKASLDKPAVAAFVEFFMSHAADLAKAVNYVALPKDVYARANANLKARKTGTQFMGPKGESREGLLVDLYK